MAPYRGAGLSHSTRAPRGKTQPSADIILAGNRVVAGMAEDNESVIASRDKLDAKGAISTRMAGPGHTTLSRPDTSPPRARAIARTSCIRGLHFIKSVGD